MTSETTAVTAVKKRTESGSNYSLTRSRKTTKKVKLHSVVNTMLLLQKKVFDPKQLISFHCENKNTFHAIHLQHTIII